MTLDARLARLEFNQPPTVTAEEFFAALMKLDANWEQQQPDPVAEMSSRMSGRELERAIERLTALIEERDQCACVRE